ncbi:MAG: hypothetical protein ACHQ9S_20670 [Candidatus Binatia bacterium]
MRQKVSRLSARNFCLPPVLLLILAGLTPAAVGVETELQKLERRLLTPPAIQVEPGFTARVIVPPGQLYDPAWMRPHGEVVWVNDDGGEEGDKGGRIVAVDRSGGIVPVADLGTLLPVVGFDVAPDGFGAYGGDIFTLAQARAGLAAATANHVIQRVLLRGPPSAGVFCTLPNNGTMNQGVSGFGAAAGFGPEHSPFAGKFFAVTMLNATVYQVTANGACTPFATFDPVRVGVPLGLQFAKDHATMLVSVSKNDTSGDAVAKRGAIVRVRPDGTIEDDPVATGLAVPSGMDFAPEGFGSYGGQLFVADAGDFDIPVKMTQPVANDGTVYRITPDGRAHLVASGFFNPSGVRFVGNALWISDINGDFIGGRRELPDGFIVEIRAQGSR